MRKVKKMELEVGKKYRIKNRRGKIWPESGGMDRFMGEIVTIKDLTSEGFICICEDSEGYCFEKTDFEPIGEMTMEEAVGELMEAAEKCRESFEKAAEAFAEAWQKLEKMKEEFEKNKPKEEKQYNVRIVCIDDRGGSFKKGKIYNVVNGKFKVEDLTMEKKEKEVVRCEECTMKKSWYETSFGITVCGQSGLFAVNDKSFCSYGEKKK